jgi:predicted DNA-binding transcriptional regulator YafY
MGNAVDVAKRLNYAREVWAEVGVLPAAVERLMRECSVGRRQAYRDAAGAPSEGAGAHP